MRLPTSLFRRGGVFYYRAKVPSDLLILVGRREVWISLKTSDRQCAELLLADIHAQQLRVYESLRQGGPNPHGNWCFRCGCFLIGFRAVGLASGSQQGLISSPSSAQFVPHRYGRQRPRHGNHVA
jgi:hypothetical protein